MANTEKKKFQFKMPHTYVILVSIMVLMLVLTHIIPAGQYDRVEDPVSGKMVVVDGTYHEIDVEAPGIFDLFLALQQGYVESANIMFLIIFSYGFDQERNDGQGIGDDGSKSRKAGSAAHSHYHAGAGHSGLHHGHL